MLLLQQGIAKIFLLFYESQYKIIDDIISFSKSSVWTDCLSWPSLIERFRYLIFLLSGHNCKPRGCGFLALNSGSPLFFLLLISLYLVMKERTSLYTPSNAYRELEKVFLYKMLNLIVPLTCALGGHLVAPHCSPTGA